MRFAIPTVLLLLLVASCQSDKLLLDNVASLSIETDHNEILNVGNHFSYTVYAELKSGETRKVKNDALIHFPDDKLADQGSHKARINAPLQDFQTTSYGFEIGLKMGSYEASSPDTLFLNFRGSIAAYWQGKDGSNGTQPRASAATLFGRDGLDGRPGGNGINGGEGAHYTGYLWEHDKELRMLLVCDSTEVRYCYRSIERDSVIIDLSGGNAGNGSAGGTGGDGKNAKTGKDPGNGGNGGVGGNGGNGGDGGSLLLFIHPNATFMDRSINLINSGGKGGAAGMGGEPGKAGKTISGKAKASSGENGAAGENGKDGENGPTLTISKVAFDYTKFQ
ncbi:hypothetical protein OAK35_03570 [Crocinitomicaceae bacterium]|nr:hypothetical protein [Crocinitomicaceae bacterium]